MFEGFKPVVLQNDHQSEFVQSFPDSDSWSSIWVCLILSPHDSDAWFLASLARNDTWSSLHPIRWHMTSISPITDDANWSFKINVKLFFFPLWLWNISFLIKLSTYSFIYFYQYGLKGSYFFFHGLSFITIITYFYAQIIPHLASGSPFIPVFLTWSHYSVSTSLL